VSSSREPGRRRWRRDESGQAVVEFALVLPVVVLLMGAAFTGWNGMQLSVRLTSAARAGAIQAAADLATNPNQVQTAWDAATTAVNNEEGTTGVYQDANPTGADYVRMTTATQAVAGGITVHVVTVTISDTAVTLVPVVGNLPVKATATARYA